jgi:hypothetical protein
MVSPTTCGSINVAFIGPDGVGLEVGPEQPTMINARESNSAPTIILLNICLFSFLFKLIPYLSSLS